MAHLFVSAHVGGAEAVDLVLNSALLGRQKFELDLLKASVLRELLVANQACVGSGCEVWKRCWIASFTGKAVIDVEVT